MKSILVKPVGKLTFKAVVEGHTFLASEPVDIGGTDAAPSPSQLMIGSIGLCTSMYADLFSTRYDFSLDGFSILLEYEQDPKTTQVLSLKISVTYPEALPEELREKFERFLDKCAVKKSITEGFPIDVEHSLPVPTPAEGS